MTQIQDAIRGGRTAYVNGFTSELEETEGERMVHVRIDETNGHEFMNINVKLDDLLAAITVDNPLSNRYAVMTGNKVVSRVATLAEAQEVAQKCRERFGGGVPRIMVEVP
jgi:predicted sulfurtransferase